jgi:hypothetical protein
MWFKGVFVNKDLSNNDKVTIDSIQKVKVIPQKQGQFYNDKPTIIYVQPQAQQRTDSYLNSLISELSSIKKESDKTNKLLQELALRVYEKTYSDSTVTIKVTDSINGKLRNQKVTWKVKPQKIKYFETKTTIEKNPKFTFSTGLGITSKLDSTANPQLQAILGFKNKKGYELQFGYSTNKTASLIFKKDILTKY